MSTETGEAQRRAAIESIVGSTISNYKILKFIGEGASSEVYEAKNNNTNEIVALKKLSYDNLEINMEIKILKKLNPHPHVITLKEAFALENEKAMYMIFEHMHRDLAAVIKEGNFAHDIKHYFKQLLTALAHCHEHDVLHRDLKVSNILVSETQTLKLADFGISRILGDDGWISRIGDHGNTGYEYLDNLTPDVIALEHRPPELILGSENYGPEVDMWSAGSVFGQLLNGGSYLVQGFDKNDQLNKIYELCGLDGDQRSLRVRYAHFDAEALNLLERMLLIDPTKRLTAKEALEHAYFA